MDQADTLRRLMQKRKSSSSGERTDGLARAQVLTVASGKGGVGKSSLVANLGALLARSGLRVLLVDGDFGLANLDILLGVQAQGSVEQVLDGTIGVREAVVGVEQNLWLLPASTGFAAARAWKDDSRERLISLFESFPWEMDLVIVDAGAGIQDNVLRLHSPLYRSLVVLTPEPTSFTDAYGLIKLLKRECAVNRVSVIVNQVTDGREGIATFQKLKDVADRFLDVRMEYLGHCVRDEKFVQAVMKRKTLLDLDSGTAAVQALELLAKRIRCEAGNPAGLNVVTVPKNAAGFWRTLLGEVKA
jgi:flagellar biosynthesis protein FlhG